MLWFKIQRNKSIIIVIKTKNAEKYNHVQRKTPQKSENLSGLNQSPGYFLTAPLIN